MPTLMVGMADEVVIVFRDVEEMVETEDIAPLEGVEMEEMGAAVSMVLAGTEATEGVVLAEEGKEGVVEADLKGMDLMEPME